MNARLSRLSPSFIGATLLVTLLLTRSAATQPQPAETDVKTRNGLTTVTFKINPGTIRVYLPDDMRAGDTISGTVSTEPQGTNDQEKQSNAQALKVFVIDIQGSRVSAGDSFFSFPVPANEPKAGAFSSEGRMDMRLLQPPNWNVLGQTSVPFKPLPTGGVTLPDPKVNPPTTQTGAVITPNPKITPPTTSSGAVITPDPKITVPKTESGAVITPDPKITPRTTSSGAVVTPDPKITSDGLLVRQEVTVTSADVVDVRESLTRTFDLPLIGQQGRLLHIVGPFDGDASNTKLQFVPRGGNLQDFEKGTENVSGGFGLVRPLAESPRKLVFSAPPGLSGTADLILNEGPLSVRAPYRSLSVQLSAPKTNLMRGEKTTLTVNVGGLNGILQKIPLQLDATGVITMDGGNFQNLWIKPEEVRVDGSYLTTRGITGQQAGGFSVTATVVVHRFDFCLQDDTDPNRLFNFNSFTGDYAFACGGASCSKAGGSSTQTGKPDGTPSPSSLNLTGVGKPSMKGCIITLSHNAPDRRVFARLDVCTKSADASVETASPKTTFNITDKNITDSAASSAPSK